MGDCLNEFVIGGNFIKAKVVEFVEGRGVSSKSFLEAAGGVKGIRKYGRKLVGILRGFVLIVWRIRVRWILNGVW